MRSRRILGLAVVAIALTGSMVACGESGSSSSTSSSSSSSAGGAGCAPVKGDELVVLQDDKHLQTVDNIIPAINAKIAQPPLVVNLDKVSAALDTDTLISLNKQVDIDRKTPENVATAFVQDKKLTDGVEKGTGKVVIGAANFSESQILANMYADVLKAGGYDTSVKTVGNRELYLPALERGELSVVPEYVGTLTEFLNKGAGQASSDLDKTVTVLTGLGDKVGLKFGTPSKAADQNAFAVNKKLADDKGLKTLSDFAAKCSGTATVLGGPPECVQRPFCQPGLEKTYGIKFGKFLPLDAGGPRTKTGLKNGQVTIGLVFSSDGSLSTNS